LEGAQTRTLNLSINRPLTSQLNQRHSQVLIPVMMWEDLIWIYISITDEAGKLSQPPPAPAPPPAARGAAQGRRRQAPAASDDEDGSELITGVADGAGEQAGSPIVAVLTTPGPTGGGPGRAA
jgi:hypothetical protein